MSRLLDTTVSSHSIGRAHVEVNLVGPSGPIDHNALELDVSHETDRYRRVRLTWDAAGQVTGTREEVRGRKRRKLLDVWLDLRTGEFDTERPA